MFLGTLLLSSLLHLIPRKRLLQSQGHAGLGGAGEHCGEGEDENGEHSLTLGSRIVLPLPHPVP